MIISGNTSSEVLLMSIERKKLKGWNRLEELILQKEDLKKECFHLDQQYLRIFGKLLMAVFESKIRCIELKKKIQLAQKEINKGQKINISEINKRIEIQMIEYYLKISKMHKEYDTANSFTAIDIATLEKIKSLYRKLVKFLHPDLNPQITANERYTEVWEMVQTAYKLNDLDLLEESEILAYGLKANKEYSKLDTESYF